MRLAMYDITCICTILHHLEEIEVHRYNMQRKLSIRENIIDDILMLISWLHGTMLYTDELARLP